MKVSVDIFQVFYEGDQLEKKIFFFCFFLFS